MEKQNVINRLNTGLKHEKLAYKIYGIVSLVLAIIIMVCGGISMVAAGHYLSSGEAYTSEISINGNVVDNEFISSDIILGEYAQVELDDNGLVIYDGDDSISINSEDAEVLAGAGVVAIGMFYMIFGVIYLAFAIVNLVISSKIGKYRLSDEATVKHAGSVGSIILAAFFNEIALIFAIINFVIAKKNRAVLEG